MGYLKPSTERTYLLTKRPSTRMMIKIDAAPIFILDPLDSMIKSLLDQNVCGHPFQSRITNVDHPHKDSSSESWSHYFKFHRRCALVHCGVNCAGSVRLVTGAVVQSVEQCGGTQDSPEVRRRCGPRRIFWQKHIICLQLFPIYFHIVHTRWMDGLTSSCI